MRRHVFTKIKSHDSLQIAQCNNSVNFIAVACMSSSVKIGFWIKEFLRVGDTQTSLPAPSVVMEPSVLLIYGIIWREEGYWVWLLNNTEKHVEVDTAGIWFNIDWRCCLYFKLPLLYAHLSITKQQRLLSCLHTWPWCVAEPCLQLQSRKSIVVACTSKLMECSLYLFCPKGEAYKKWPTGKIADSKIIWEPFCRLLKKLCSILLYHEREM
jgi:hypothetical protein